MLISGKIGFKEKREIKADELKDFLVKLDETAKPSHDELDLDAELAKPIDFHSKTSLDQ